MIRKDVVRATPAQKRDEQERKARAMGEAFDRKIGRAPIPFDVLLVLHRDPTQQAKGRAALTASLDQCDDCGEKSATPLAGIGTICDACAQQYPDSGRLHPMGVCNYDACPVCRS